MKTIMQESDNEQEYMCDDWETMSFHFGSDDEDFEDVIEVESVRKFVREKQAAPKPLPKAITSLEKTCNSPRDEKKIQKESEIEVVKQQLVWCEQREAEGVPMPLVEELDADFPSLSQSVKARFVKQNTDFSDGWKTIINKEASKSISDPVQVSKLLQKTQMCESAKMSTVCRHGNRCRFAHTPEELVIRDCAFNVDCRFVVYRNGVYCNSRGKKICTRIHPEEQIEEYYYRTGLKIRPAPSEDEMQVAFDEYLALTAPVKSSPVKKEKKFAFKKFENVQNKPKKVAIVVSPRKFVSEDLETQKIKDRSEISARIRDANVSLGRKQETIDRFRKMSPLTEFYKKQIKKLEGEISDYNGELVTLGEKLKAVDSMKKVEVVQPIAPVVEEKKETPVSKKVKQESSVLLIVPNKKIEAKVIPVPEPVADASWIEVNKDRTKAFNILEDKSKIDQKLTRTQMCTFGKTCRRGKACRFAHSKEELVVNTCIFGNSCKFVSKTCRGFENMSKTKTCMFRHPEEHINNYFYRVGIDKVPVRSQPVLQPRPIRLPVSKPNATTHWASIVKK